MTFRLKKELLSKTFCPIGSVPEHAAVPMFPAVLFGETPRGGSERLCWIDHELCTLMVSVSFLQFGTSGLSPGMSQVRIP